MRVRVVPAVLCVLSVLAMTTLATDRREQQNQNGKQAGFELFKQLAGEWEGKEISGHEPMADVHVKYAVTSAGSAVVETLFPGTAHEMVTVIHPDGDDLALTHYCALGNQPHMKAAGAGEGNTVAFKFTGASNLKSEKSPHMHDATYTFVDKDTLKTEWTHYVDGKPGGKVVFELKRKK
jgi:hypothetical protein